MRKKGFCSSPGTEGEEPLLAAAQNSWTGWLPHELKAAMKTFEKVQDYQREMNLPPLSEEVGVVM